MKITLKNFYLKISLPKTRKRKDYLSILNVSKGKKYLIFWHLLIKCLKDWFPKENLGKERILRNRNLLTRERKIGLQNFSASSIRETVSRLETKFCWQVSLSLFLSLPSLGRKHLTITDCQTKTLQTEKHTHTHLSAIFIWISLYKCACISSI